MSVAVFKQALWSKQINNVLDTLTGLKNHSDFSYEGEVKGGNVLKITGSVRPSVGNYVPGTDINYESVGGISQELNINIYKYATQKFDDVDRAQSIPGVMENATKEMAKAIADQVNIEVANKMKDAVTTGVTITNNAGTSEILTVPQEAAATAVSKANALTRIDDGVQALQENNVAPTEKLWGEFSPAYYKCIRQGLFVDLTNNVELAKEGIVGEYNNVQVCIENLLPVDTVNKIKFNFIRTGKAVAFAGVVEKTEAGRLEKQFADYVRALYAFGTKVVRPKEMYAIKEKTA